MISDEGKILFRFGSDIQPITRFGELVLIYRSCYFKGKELGYKDGYIFFEWPLNIEYTKNHYLQNHNMPLEGKIKTLVCPKETILPIKFIEQQNVVNFEYDRIINLTETGVFYKDSPPLYNQLNKDKRNHIAFFNYLNKYYIDFKEYPIFTRNKPKDKYILFHIRNALYSTTRNPDINSYIPIIKLLKDKYKTYKLYRCGEISENDNEFNDLFNKYFETITSLNDFLKLMSDSSLFVGCCSGPIDYAFSFGVPIIEVDLPSSIDWGYGYEKYDGMGSFYSKKAWKEGFNGIYGDTVDYHIDSDSYLKLYKGDKTDYMEIDKFLEKWLK